MIPPSNGLDGLRAAMPQMCADMDKHFGIHTGPQRGGTGIGSLVDLPDVGEDGVRFRRFLHLGLGQTPQSIPLSIQDVGNGPHRG